MRTEHKMWLNEFLENCRRTNKSVYTIINYRSDLQKYISWYEKTNQTTLNSANARTISTYQSHLQLGVASRRRHTSAIKNFYEYLKQADETDTFKANPVRTKLHSVSLKQADVDSTKLLTEADWSAILENTHNLRDLLIVNLLYWGGFRLSELSQLKLENFNQELGTVSFVRKGGDVHTLHIQEWSIISELLQKHVAKEGIKSGFLFLNNRGSNLTPRTMYNVIMRVLTRAKCPTQGITPHSFRKACASNLYAKTKDLLLVRDYLNHSDATVTQTYIEHLEK